MKRVVVVGASLAGVRAAEALRHAGFDGELTIVGDEPHEPYDRPPLSKQLLAGTWPDERAVLKVDREALAAEWRLGARATGLDLAARRVALEDGTLLPFDGLVIATGATPRTLPGVASLAGVHTLRTLDDCLALRKDLDGRPGRVVVVGAGFIGAEVAATCRGRGVDVTVLETLPVPLGRVLGERIGSVCAELHRDHGVDLRTDVAVAGFEGGGRVGRVRLADGSAVEADVVVVGIGVRPNTSWLEGSGLALDDGVVCDETCLAAPGVVAAGDVARWPNRRFSEVMRVEHWTNAVEQGDHAASTLLRSLDGQPGEPYAPVPYFWSDQYDRKIQLVGRSTPADEVQVVVGGVEDRQFVALYRHGDRVVGALACNRPRHLMAYRALIDAGASWEKALAAEV